MVAMLWDNYPLPKELHSRMYVNMAELEKPGNITHICRCFAGVLQKIPTSGVLTAAK